MARQQSLLPSVERQRTPTERRPERTALYRAVHEDLETFLARAPDQDRPIPRFVERELRAYLECGLPAFGFGAVHHPLRYRVADDSGLCSRVRTLFIRTEGPLIGTPKAALFLLSARRQDRQRALPIPPFPSFLTRPAQTG